MNSLINLYRSSFLRLSDPKEQNKPFLTDQIKAWRSEILSLTLHETDPETFGSFSRLLLAVSENDPIILVPILNRLLSSLFAETMKTILAWNFLETDALFQEVLRQDPSVGSILTSAMTGKFGADVIRILVKNLSSLQNDDLKTFKKNLSGRSMQAKLFDFLEDSDPQIRST
ncbi:hypothetical protein HYY75_04315, partial [bacterium]|nr:hypothetical protein [bacterium]